MSLVFGLLFVMGFMLVDRSANYCNRSGPGSVPGPIGIPSRVEPRAGRPTSALIADLISVSLLAVLGLAAYHAIAARSSSPNLVLRQPIPLSDNAKRQLEAELADSAVVADLGTLKAYQKALVDELANTTDALGSRPRDTTLLKRKELIDLVLTNAGGTGVNDRLSDFEIAMRTVASQSVSTDADAQTLRLAVSNLHNSVASWKTGAFGNLGTFLGLHWDDGRGLTVGSPYIWGKNGWEADPLARKTCEQGIGPRLRAE